jgi:arsenate reductase
MAEGLMNHFLGSEYRAFSAGTEKTTVNPLAKAVMKELGIDISHHSSKLVTEFAGKEFDVVVTVCDNAREACPFFPGKKVIHRAFIDPSGAPEANRLEAFRKSRDEILEWIVSDFGKGR